MVMLKTDKIPSDDLTLTNCAVIHTGTFTEELKCKHARVKNTQGETFFLTLERTNEIGKEKLGLNVVQRRWTRLNLDENVPTEKYSFDPKKEHIDSIVLEADFMHKKSTTTEPYNTDEMREQFRNLFVNHAFSVNQPILFQFKNMKLLKLTVKSIEVADFTQVKDTSSQVKRREAHFGLFVGNSVATFEKATDSCLNLTGKAKGKSTHESIINPDWDFNKMGIGGLDDEFSAIFRRAFSSRVFPPEVIEQLGMKHARGILLFGPPGTGKTLMARQIGKMLNAREPKIISGPQILNKYVGESESNIRQLFADAEDEEKKMGINSGLHIIIFDEIDAICKARGSVTGNTGVHDTVVNQLLAKLDGVDQLNNILLIGMTNRKDMIDEALLRAGRLEVHMEIGLPNEPGRLQILHIHTSKMTEHNKLANDVDLNELAALTKNFSGAEIEGLVRSATSIAMNRLIKATSKVEVDPEAPEKLKVTRSDFLHSLKYDVKPAFGTSSDEIYHFMPNGIINWGTAVQRVLDEGDLLISQTKLSEHTPLVTVLLEGQPSSGKTALAAEIAKRSDFPFLKVCSPNSMIGYHDSAKCQAIKKIFDDAHKSPLSCIVLDDIERLFDYISIGPRFSNLAVQALLVLLKELPPHGRKLMVLATTNCVEVLQEMDLYRVFSKVIHVSSINSADNLVPVLQHMQIFDDAEIQQLMKKIRGKRLLIGIKKLLSLIERVRQVPENERLTKFQFMLEDEAGLEM